MQKNIKNILSEVIKKLKTEYEPLKIILFGSYAYGKPSKDSDIDLLILKNTKKRRTDRFVIVKRIIYDPSRKIPISPLVYTKTEIENHIKNGDDFIKDILQRGVILYEKGGNEGLV